jgi:hypothetical protein
MEEQWAPMVWLAAVLGLHWCEVAGLRRKRVDLERGLLTVAKPSRTEGKAYSRTAQVEGE